MKKLTQYINESFKKLSPELFILDKLVNNKLTGELHPATITNVPSGWNINSGPFKDIDELRSYAKKKNKILANTDILDFTK